MKRKLFTVVAGLFLTCNIIFLSTNINASEISMVIMDDIPIKGASYPPLKACYTLADYGGIVGVWKCIPCIFLSFARPWGDFSYCMPSD